MTISALDALNNWKNAIDNGDIAGLDNMLQMILSSKTAQVIKTIKILFWNEQTMQILPVMSLSFITKMKMICGAFI